VQVSFECSLKEGFVPLVLLILLVAFGAMAAYALSWTLRASGLRRVTAALERYPVEPVSSGYTRPAGKLARWVYLAGFRKPGDLTMLGGAAIASVAAGALAAFVLRSSGVIAELRSVVVVIPGFAGELLDAILAAGPWIVVLLLASAPWLVVRAARRKRVTQVEQDLPMTLELLATLAEAGLTLMRRSPGSCKASPRLVRWQRNSERFNWTC
jgi:Flp pilus assembly protein TadB